VWSSTELAQQHLVGDALVPDGTIDAQSCSLAGSTFSSADHGGLAALGERAVLVVDVGDAAAHAAAKLRPVRPSTTTGAAGHVLAAVVAGAFDDRRRTRQPHRESARPATPRRNASPLGGP
jgi:hypothetical protein